MASSESYASSNDTSAAVASEAVERFRLLDLPPEIWSNIGKMAIEAEPDHQFFKYGYLGKNYQPSVTRTCRTLRQELLPFFWETKFNMEFYSWGTAASQLGEVLKTVGKDARHAMRGLWARGYDNVDVPKIGIEQDLRVRKGWNFEFELGELKGPIAQLRWDEEFGFWEREVAYNVKFH